MNSSEVIRIVARREVTERVRTRGYRLGTLLQMAIVVGIVVVAAVTGGSGLTEYKVGIVGSGSSVVAERAEAMAESFGAELELVTFDDRDALRAAVLDGDADAGIAGQSIVVEGEGDGDLMALIQASAAELSSAEALTERGLSEDEIAAVLGPEPLEVASIGDDNAGAGSIAFLGTLLLYVAIVGAGYMVVGGIVEEKGSRVVEILLAAIKPGQLFLGKVIGIGIVNITQIALVVVAGLAAALLLGSIELPSTTGQVVLMTFVYFVLGYALYACAFGAAGALVSRQEDTAGATSPLLILLIGGYLAALGTLGDPNGGLATVLTYVPPIAPMVVPARVALEAISLPELLLSLGLMIVSIAFLLRLAMRLYERAVLRMGAPIGVREALSLLRR